MKKEEAEDIMRENIGENIVKNTRKEENVEAAKVKYGEMRGKQWSIVFRVWNLKHNCQSLNSHSTTFKDNDWGTTTMSLSFFVKWCDNSTYLTE